MKIRMILIASIIALAFFGVTMVLAQSAVDWERVCPSGTVELDAPNETGVLVRCFLSAALPTPTETPVVIPTETAVPPTPTNIPPTPTNAPPVGGGIVVDHTSVALFDRIPVEYLRLAREMPMMFSDRSVGQNMNEALDCLAAPSWALSPSRCRRDYLDTTQTTWKTFTANDTVPALIQFPGGAAYSRANWTYADCQGTWDVMTELFVGTVAPPFLASKDVLSCQFSYLNVAPGSTIANPVNGYFATDVHLLEAFAGQNPDKTFVFWTTSLARITGTVESTEFNNQMRAYAAANDAVLMDMADIISHDRNGNPCYLPGTNYPVICRDYTTEANGGHLGSVSGGQIQMAKAFWVLMAQIAGWTP